LLKNNKWVVAIVVILYPSDELHLDVPWYIS